MSPNRPRKLLDKPFVPGPRSFADVTRSSAPSAPHFGLDAER